MDSAAGSVPEMVYAVSHDIGEPMREIIGFAQLLARRAPQSADPRFWDELNHVEQGAQRAREMLEALCEFLKAEELQPQAELTDVGDLVELVLNDIDDTLTAYPADITIEVDPSGGEIMSYPQELRSILGELTTNAARFARTGDQDRPRVSIAMRSTASTLHLTVEDDGPGIAADARHRALQLFQRLHRRSDLDTLGVGLALVRRQVQACEGTIELGQTSTGHGLRVDVTLPLPVLDLRDAPEPTPEPHDLAS